MFRFILVAALAAMLIAPVVSAEKVAGEKRNVDVYYTQDVADLTTKPGTGGGWEAGFPSSIADNDSVWFGSPNIYIPEWRKKYFLKLYGDSTHNLEAPDAKGYKTTDSLSDRSNITKSTIAGGVKFYVLFTPQPEWEVVLVKNASGQQVAIDSVKASSTCYPTPVPSLTTYGIIVLVLLLLASTVWVIRKKRAHAPA